MSPVNDTRLSSKLIASAVISLVLSMTACLPSRRPTGPQMVSDRLVDLLIRQQLPLGDPDSPLRGEVQRCGQWFREHLENNQSEVFRLESADNRLTATSNGATRLLVPELALRLIRLKCIFPVQCRRAPLAFYGKNGSRNWPCTPHRTGAQEMVRRDGKTESIQRPEGLFSPIPTKDSSRFISSSRTMPDGFKDSVKQDLTTLLPLNSSGSCRNYRMSRFGLRELWIY